MKLFSLAILAAVLVPNLSSAVGISLSSSATGHRFYLPSAATTPVPNTGFIEVGWMTDETNGNTFVSFGTAAIHGNAAFPDGLGNAAYNTNAPETTSAAGKPVYIRVYSGASLGVSLEAGIFKTTSVNYPSDFAPASVNGAIASLALDGWTTVNPTTNWDFRNPSATFATGGNTGSAGNPPTARTGNVFTLGANIPEPSASMLLALLGLSFGFRRRR